MGTLKKTCIILVCILAIFAIYLSATYTNDPEKLFVFELRNNEQGEQYYAVTNYIGRRQYFSFMSITIPAEYKGLPVYLIEEFAFEGANIKSIKISNGITEIGKHAFQSSNLVEIVIPDSVESIGAYAFSFCRELEKVVLPTNLKTIEDDTFSFCYKLADIVLPKKLESIGTGAFANCSSLGEIDLPSSLKIINTQAFYYCSSLENLYIPEGTHTIAPCAFSDCSTLAEITLPSSLTTLGERAFMGCNSLKTVKFTGTESDWIFSDQFSSECSIILMEENNHSDVNSSDVTTSTAKLRFEETENGACYRLVGVNGPVSGELVIPEKHQGLPVKVIADNAFAGCSDLESIILPDSIVYVGSCAFRWCDNLTSISMPGITSIETDTFSECTSIKKLTIPSDFISYVKSQPLEAITITCVSSTKIQSSALKNNKTLKSVTIQEGITIINEDAFAGCNLLETVSLPNSLTIIGRSAFGDCAKLKNIVLPSTVQEIHFSAFHHCGSLTEIKIPGSVISLGDGSFYHCESLKNVIIEEGVEYIGGYDHILTGAFQNCNISTISLPTSLKYINANSFLNNPLVSVEFKNPVGWEIRPDMYHMLSDNILLDENDLANPAFAANILLMLDGGEYTSMKRG